MERRVLRFQHMDDAVADARRLAEHGYDRVGNWSLEQNLDHLNRSLRMAQEPIAFKLPWFMRPLLKWLVFPKMRKGAVIRMRASAPKDLQPGEDLNLAEQLQEFERLAGIIESPDSKLLELHPVFGKLNREEWQIMQRWHASHHLSFLLPREAA
ncbi:MAG: DUF1569 domain-containing protein [Planctomycetales bacterium]|nr:DUF1569 domain-containing protein [Planctomycetales bacterium]